MSDKYPRLGPIHKRLRNISAKCKCGAIGKYKVEIQVDIFRGNDEIYWACEGHKKDIEFLNSPLIRR